MFEERLKQYREHLEMTKREMADKLEIGESYYNMIENGKRSPSKAVIIKLVNLTHKPEEYWIYGIDEDDYLKERDTLKSLFETLNLMKKTHLYETKADLEEKIFNNIEVTGDNDMCKLILAALRTDFEYFLTEDKK